MSARSRLEVVDSLVEEALNVAIPAGSVDAAYDRAELLLRALVAAQSATVLALIEVNEGESQQWVRAGSQRQPVPENPARPSAVEAFREILAVMDRHGIRVTATQAEAIIGTSAFTSYRPDVFAEALNEVEQQQPARDLRPHSRACGMNCPGHYRGCSKDCPTCQGKIG